jgi:hypothetical protein
MFKVLYPAISQNGLDRNKWRTHAWRIFETKSEAVAFAKQHGATRVVEQKVY